MKELDSIINNSNRVEYTKYSKKRIGADANDKSNETKPNFFINLSNYELTKDEVNFLNLGINYHIQPKYSKIFKETEIEQLYTDLTDLNNKEEIYINNCNVVYNSFDNYTLNLINKILQLYEYMA